MTLITNASQWSYGFLLNFVLISLACRYPLLTKSGWVNAGILGTILFGCLGWKGWLAVVIYLALGSLVTKLGYAYKKSKGISEGRDGKRGPENVWGSAATGAGLALIYNLVNGSGEYLLFMGFAASFAAKLADTFGSEIGKRWGKNTILITTFEPVSAGTEGAISLQGTLASIFGSFLMSVVMVFLGFIPTLSSFLIVFICGVVATLLESVLGAVAQDKTKWLTNELINFLQTSVASILSILVASFS